MPCTILEGPYLQDILDQPRALRDTVAAMVRSQKLNDFIKDLTVGRYEQVVLTGMGGSFLILYPLYLTLTQLGFPARLAETSEMLHFMPGLLTSRTLLVVASQSGRSAEIVRLLKQKNDRPTILAITNDETSPLARDADVVGLIQAGPEASGACKTTTATLAALAWISETLSTRDFDSAQNLLEQAAPEVERYLANWRHHVEQLSEQFHGFRHLFITGRGSSLPAAGIGGMLMKETAHFHAEGMGSAAFRHGPFEMLRADCFVLAFAGDSAVEPLNSRWLKTCAERVLVGK